MYRHTLRKDETPMGDEKLLKEIGLRVSNRRRELRLTQEQVAEQMDVSVQMISNLELGRKAIRPENLVKICDVLKVSADYLLTGNPSDKELLDMTHKIAKLSGKQQYLLDQLIDTILESK